MKKTLVCLSALLLLSVAPAQASETSNLKGLKKQLLSTSKVLNREIDRINKALSKLSIEDINALAETQLEVGPDPNAAVGMMHGYDNLLFTEAMFGYIPEKL